MSISKGTRSNITGSARLSARDRGISGNLKHRSGVDRCNFVRGFTGGCILLFAEEIPESNAAPDAHTVMIASVFARTEDLSRCRWYTTPHGIFSAPSHSNSLPTVKTFTTFVPCKRSLRVLTPLSNLSTLGQMTGAPRKEGKEKDILSRSISTKGSAESFK